MNIKSCACVLLHSFKVCDFNPTERKIHFRENWLIFWGNLGEAELILGICEARQNTFRELMKKISGILVDQCIILREHRLPPGRPQEHITHISLASFLWNICKLYRPRSDAAKRVI